MLVRVTSASSTKLTVSDQSRTLTLIFLPLREKLSVSIRVNGQGPAMQVTLPSRNSFPSPASSEAPPTAAFHFPSGEQGGCSRQGTLPRLATSKLFSTLPVSIFVLAFSMYRTRMSEIGISEVAAEVPSTTGFMRRT